MSTCSSTTTWRWYVLHRAPLRSRALVLVALRCFVSYMHVHACFFADDDTPGQVIEFGYVTLFASAFPLAAAVSVVANFIEVRSDAFRIGTLAALVACCSVAHAC